MEEFIAYIVWPLAHGWDVGEVKLRLMPFLKGRQVLSPAFNIELQDWDVVDFVQEVEVEAVRIVGKYSMKMEGNAKELGYMCFERQVEPCI